MSATTTAKSPDSASPNDKPPDAVALDHLCMALRHPLRVRVRRIAETGLGLDLPSYAHDGDAGLDLQAAIPDAFSIPPGETMKVPTGFAFAIPPGWNGEVRPRSGTAFKKGLIPLNTPGTIDATFRGELSVLLHNTNRKDPQTITRGERIAQLVIVPVGNAAVVEVDDLDQTPRGAGGFGSTGT